MGVKLVVFDMAGTTVEDEQNVAYALQQALSDYGFKVHLNDINVVMGYAKPMAIRILLGQHLQEDPAITDKDTIELVHKRFVSIMKGFYQHSTNTKAKAGAEQVFAALRKRGIKVAMDTGFSREIADAIFEKLGWVEGRDFDLSVTSDEVKNGRPYPDMIYRAMDTLGVHDINEVAKVGDTQSDLQEGNAAGCKYVIGITTGAYTAAELAKERHTHLASNLAEVFDILTASELALT